MWNMIKMMLGLAVITMVGVACSPKKESPKILVLYYSQTSNTKVVAQEIATRLNADIEEIVPVEPYDTAFEATIERCMKEREQGITPEIQPLKSNIADYDVIFIGYPVWFGTYAPPVAALLDKIDLGGKKVVPFCTFGSGGLESSTKDLAAKQPNAKILRGYGVRAARMDAVTKEVDQFLKASGFIEGEFFQPTSFPELYPVSADEAAIFDAAVDGYPMLNAKSTSVAKRDIPEGVEYVFLAEDQPRDDKDGEPREIVVYVIVEKGKAPVFTKVVR